MPHTHQPDPSPSILAKPICPACGNRLRLALAKPSPHFVNIKECIYRCDCEQGDYFVVAEDK
jgi:hypothetical protein